MAIDKDSNAFTFFFAAALVVVVGLVLSVAAMSLKDRQVRNVQNEKMQGILAACNIEVTRKEAEERFMDVVSERLILDSTGSVMYEKSGEIDRKDKEDAFNVSPRDQMKKKGAGNINRFALFICEKDGHDHYVVPMAGNGLWGPIWGYISLKPDLETVYGAVFDHSSETPGLGAEIAGSNFQDQFQGKKIFDENGDFKPVNVTNESISEEEANHAVDGITGGTVTSHGVRDMIERTLSRYTSYFKKLQEEKEVS